MFRKRNSKKVDEVLTPTLAALIPSDVTDRERTEHSDAHGPTPYGHAMSEYDEELGDHESTGAFRDPLDEEAGEVQAGKREFSVTGIGEARRATGDEVADTVNTVWRQRFEDDPEDALDDLQARVNALGYRLAYAGRTHLEPVNKRTYHIIDRDMRQRMDVFYNGDADLTLFDVCLWSELAFKRWKDSDSQASRAHGSAENGATTVTRTH